MGRLIVKGKHTIKAGYHPHINMTSKPETMRRVQCRNRELHLKLRDQQLETILHMYRLLYQNLMGNATKNYKRHMLTKEKATQT